MKHLALVLFFVPLAAFAGKAERDFMKSEVTPAVTEAQAAFKTACGCDLKISIDEATIKSVDEMRLAKYIAQSVTTGAPEYCTDAPAKKAVCKMKSLKLAKAKETKFTFAGTAGTATTDGQAVANFAMMTDELDK
jgi:hypothetical protein